MGRFKYFPRSWCLVICWFLLVSCSDKSKEQTPANSVEARSTTVAASSAAIPVTFEDVTHHAKISFVHNTGAYGKKYLPESMGSGCAFLDYNNDGWLDILLVNSMHWPENRGNPTYSALYQNNHDGTFVDVTARAKLTAEMYGLGVTAADYDNDGDQDLYFTTLGSDRLFQNNGNGTFTDVTTGSGIAEDEFGTSATWFDYNRDGLLDLYVCNYVKWTKESDLFCTLDGTTKSYCTPESYPGASPRLYRNLGKGKFVDKTKEAKLLDPTSKALGVVAIDFDNDGWHDLFVANDTQPNKLYRNQRNGRFEEVGVEAGVAFSEAGVARAGMGVDAADYDASGAASLLVGNFSNEMIGLYHNEGKGLFIDEAPASAVGQRSLLTLTFGAFFFDYDLDGWIDIFAANGHVHDDIQRVQSHVTYAQPPHLFRNTGNKRFEEMTGAVGSDLRKAYVARGAAYGDYDNDGDLDILISTNGGPAHLFRNNDANKHNFIVFHLIGQKSNRDAIGAKVVIELNGVRHSQHVKAASSYCSQSQRDITFGLGRRSSIDRVTIEWPGGTRQTLRNVAANQRLTIQER